MKSNDVYWSLYNEIKGRQIDGLSFIQVKGISETMDPASVNQWLAWHEGLTDWALLETFVELWGGNGPQRREVPIPPVSPTAGRPGQQGSGEEDTGELELGVTRVVDQRFNKRFVKNYNVMVNAGSTVYKTRTVNISLGGMRVHDPIPESLGSKFTITLSRKGGFFIQLKCVRILGPSGPQTRLRFLDAEDTDLRAWLLDTKVD